MQDRVENASQPASPIALAAIGRFNSQKNFPWMIRALGGCDFPWVLTLIGDGTQRAEIESEIKKNRLGDRVRLLGWTAEGAMRDVLARSDVLLMPSTSEGNPVAAIEALKHGVDAEADGGVALLAALTAQAPDVVQALQLAPRKVPSSRAALAAADPLADAGYLVGHLESLCGTKRLLATGGDVEAYLTLCDHAADRLQTHHPTDVLRLDPVERAVVRAALVRR